MIQFALIAVYFACMGWAAQGGPTWLRAVALGAALGAALTPSLRRGRPAAWAGWLAGCALLALAARWRLDGALAVAPSVLVPWFLAAVFGASLLPGRTALVRAIGERARGPLEPALARHAEAVTALWALFLAALGAVALLTHLAGSQRLWFIATHVGAPLATAALFVGEWLYRRWRFRDHDHPGFFEYLRIVRSGGRAR